MFKFISHFIFLTIFICFSGCAQDGPIRRAIKEKYTKKLEKIAFDSDNAPSPFPVIDRFNNENLTAGDYRRITKFQSRERFYDIHLPSNFTINKKFPVVFVFHGGGGNPEQARSDYGMDMVSDENDFIVVYPAGTGKSRTRFLTFNAGECCGYAKENNINDLGFVNFILDELENNLNIDPKKIYASGLSNGAFMSYRLACDSSNRFAAIAPVAGVLGKNLENCNPSNQVPIIHFHGKKDEHILYNGGISKVGFIKEDWVSVNELIYYWLNINKIEKESLITSKIGNAILSKFGPNAQGTKIKLWTLEDGGHTWPGGKSKLKATGKVNQDINASELIWDFFKQYSR